MGIVKDIVDHEIVQKNFSTILVESDTVYSKMLGTNIGKLGFFSFVKL